MLSVCALQGFALLVRQQDRPGLIAGVSTILGRDDINISFMTVTRTGRGAEAIMAIGIDSRPKVAVLEEINKIQGVLESISLNEQ